MADSAGAAAPVTGLGWPIRSLLLANYRMKLPGRGHCFATAHTQPGGAGLGLPS